MVDGILFDLPLISFSCSWSESRCGKVGFQRCLQTDKTQSAVDEVAKRLGIEAKAIVHFSLSLETDADCFTTDRFFDLSQPMASDLVELSHRKQLYFTVRPCSSRAADLI
jgi:hypothetical protein